MTSGEASGPTAPGDMSLRVVLAQLDMTVGDLGGNVELMAAAYVRADAAGADLVLFPELAICGYPPEDLLLKPGFVEHSQEAVADLARRCDGRAAAVVGWVEGHRELGADPHDAMDGPWNAAAVLHGGRIVGSVRKQALPNYGVFDEKRYFDPGSANQPLFRIAGALVAVSVCEDAWVAGGPFAAAAGAGAQVIVNINASPFHRGKQRERFETLAERSAEVRTPIAYVNLVGGQDELVFDGGSVVLDGDGRVLAEAPRFSTSELLVDVPIGPARQSSGVVVDVSGSCERRSVAERDGETSPPRDLAGAGGAAGPISEWPISEGPAEVWSALVLGVRDYVAKNGFGDVVIGLSGGVDSAIVSTIAVDALGPERVHGVLMPSRYSSAHSIGDAVRLSENLGIDHRTIPIEAAHSQLLDLLAPSFGDRPADLAEENLQSRIRGVLLMALSNKFGWMVLTTGNKSETAVGYSTLYGDTAGGLAVIKDVPKLLVYELCRWRNQRAGTDVIPEDVLTKPPSAELRPDQRDDQSLPAYEELDPLIQAYVDDDLTETQLLAAGHDRLDVERITTLIDRAEYKRRQSPPGIRISQKAFGRDRRLPITNAY